MLHGYARLTADVDLILDLERHAAARAMRALVALGLRPRVPVDAEDFADERARESWVRDKGMRVFSLYKPDDPLLAVDVFAEHPVDFERLFERADVCEVGAVPIRIASPSPAVVTNTVGSPRRSSSAFVPTVVPILIETAASGAGDRPRKCSMPARAASL